MQAPNAPLTCTRYRHELMWLVMDYRIMAQPGAKPAWLRIAHGSQPAELHLTSAQSRALHALHNAKLIRVSVAGKGPRMVFPTEAGKVWFGRGSRARRGTSNSNSRGNSKDRQRRRRWLIDTYGDGTSAPCWLAVPGVCAKVVTVDTVSVERVTPGHAGGTYRRNNIRPACSACQSHQGGLFGIEQARNREAARRARHLMNV